MYLDSGQCYRLWPQFPAPHSSSPPPLDRDCHTFSFGFEHHHHMIWYNLSSYSTDPRHRHLQQPERTSNNFKAIIKNLNWIALMQIKLTVTWGSDADLVFSVRAHTWQATARALGARTEPVPGLETCSTQHWTLTPRSPHWPMAINCRVCLYVGEQHKKDIF